MQQGYIEIIDIKSGRRVVTVIEILSPSNKVAGPGRDLYLKKQEELREGGVSLVEINLNRTGSHVLWPVRPNSRRPATPYAACVRGVEALRLEYIASLCASGCPQSPSLCDKPMIVRPARPPSRCSISAAKKTVPRRHRLPRRSRPAAHRRRRPLGRRLAPRARPPISSRQPVGYNGGNASRSTAPVDDSFNPD